MKFAEIQVGEHYFLREPNMERAGYQPTHGVVIEKDPKRARRVFSGARWDMSGHWAEGPMVRIEGLKINDGWVTPQQVGGLWEDWLKAKALRDEELAEKQKEYPITGIVALCDRFTAEEWEEAGLRAASSYVSDIAYAMRTLRRHRQ